MGKVHELLTHTAPSRKRAQEPEPATEYVVEAQSLTQVLNELETIRQVLAKATSTAEQDRARLEQIETNVSEALTLVRAPRAEPPVPEPHPRYDSALNAIRVHLAEIDAAIASGGISAGEMESRTKALIEAVKTQAENRHKQTQAAIAAVAAQILPPQPLPAPPVYRLRVVGKDVNNRPTEMLLEPVDK